MKDKYGADNWYDWRLKNYGCKWDCTAEYSPSIEDIEKYNECDLQVWFESPWCPPDKWFQKLCETFPNLEIRNKYEEEGCCFMGVMKNDNGRMINQYIEY